MIMVMCTNINRASHVDCVSFDVIIHYYHFTCCTIIMIVNLSYNYYNYVLWRPRLCSSLARSLKLRHVDLGWYLDG